MQYREVRKSKTAVTVLDKEGKPVKDVTVR